jgi:excisionase family DNA binding protein
MTSPPAPPLPGAAGEILTPAEVAALWKVDPKTVVRWANSGKLRSFRTPGGHRRFYREDVTRALRARMNGGGPQ